MHSHARTIAINRQFSLNRLHAAVFLLSLLAVMLLQRPVHGQPVQDVPEPKRLLVIAPEAFHEALGPFIAHKQPLLPTELVSLQKVLEDQAGVDDPEKLKRYLYNQWKNHHAGYALLVGDADVFPVRYMVLDRIDAAAFNYAFYPSDLYYSDLAKSDGSFEDWNAQKEGIHAQYFGEVRGEHNKNDPINFDEIDYLPDIAVGRWPVSTPEEVALVADKSIRFENSVLEDRSPHLRRAAMFSVSGWIDSRRSMDRWSRFLGENWDIEKRYSSYSRRDRNLRGRRQDSTSSTENPPPHGNEVCNVLNSGVSLAVHAGHGQKDHWEKSLMMHHLDQLDNADALPVVVSASCHTANFSALGPYEPYIDIHGKEHVGTDSRKQRFSEPPPPPAPYQTGRYNVTGIGEQLLKRDANGAVAYIGCNTGSQPCGLTLVEGFIHAWANHPRNNPRNNPRNSPGDDPRSHPQPRLGDAWASAIIYYHEKQRLNELVPTESWYPPTVFFQGMKFMVFGDPSLLLPTTSTATAE